jgi:hypothetical protein
MMNKEFINYDPPQPPRLACPNCREDSGLHHTEIEIFNRKKQDSNKGAYVYSDYMTTVISDDVSTMDGNPSTRRDGIRIKFFCEFCDDLEFILTIVQHKGTTYMQFLPEALSKRGSKHIVDDLHEFFVDRSHSPRETLKGLEEIVAAAEMNSELSEKERERFDLLIDALRKDLRDEE